MAGRKGPCGSCPPASVVLSQHDREREMRVDILQHAIVELRKLEIELVGKNLESRFNMFKWHEKIRMPFAPSLVAGKRFLTLIHVGPFVALPPFKVAKRGQAGWDILHERR